MSPHKPIRVFAENAHNLREHGLAVMPLGIDKTPMLAGFNKWRRPPGRVAVDKFAAKYGDENIAILARQSGLALADGDDMDAVREAIRIYGDTPLKVKTSRGAHLYYRDNGIARSRNLRKSHGINLDIKAGFAGYVVAPPSVHESGMVYEFLEGSWADLKRVPLFRPDALPNGKHEHANTTGNDAENETRDNAEHRQFIPDGVVKEGERGLELNRLLCREVFKHADLDGLLACAVSINASFDPPLAEVEVVERAKQVWKDRESGKLVQYEGGPAQVRHSLEEMRAFTSRSADGAPAYCVLQELRVAHQARVDRGGTFVLVVDAMHKAGFGGGHVSRDKLRRYLKLLIEMGSIVKVRDAIPGVRAAEYVFGVTNTEYWKQ